METFDDLQRRNAPLRTEIELVRGGVGHAASVRRTVRESVLLLPRSGAGGVMATDLQSIRWVYAFTSPRELALFAAERGGAAAEVDYLTVRGDRLLDEIVPACGGPAGLAVDVCGENPMVFPPVAGLVPKTWAIDQDEDD